MKEEELWSLCELNQKPEVVGENFFPKKLKIYDTTLRDGEQTIGVTFDKKEKLEIAKMLDEMGVDRIEAGMPVVSKEDKKAVELILKAGLKAEIWGFCRAVKGDVEACADTGVKHIIIEIATSPYKMKAYNFTPEGVLGKALDCLQYAKSRGLYTAFFAVDASRADLTYLETIYKKAVNEGKADEVVIVDIQVGSAQNRQAEVPTARPPNYSHFARVLGLDVTAGKVFVENTLRGSSSYWELSLRRFWDVWLYPETSVSIRAPFPEEVTRWGVLID